MYGLSTWTALCHWCPDRPDGRGGSLGPPTFTGMALTTDGYETATYARPRSPQLGYTVPSPRDDVFLLKDAANGREWLVDVDDGTEHRVARVDSELAPANPRLWLECGIARGDGSTSMRAEGRAFSDQQPGSSARSRYLGGRARLFGAPAPRHERKIITRMGRRNTHLSI